MDAASGTTQKLNEYGPVAAALVGVPLVAALLIPLRGHLDNTNIALIMVVAVVAVSLTGRRVAAVLAALSAAFWFDFFFTVPFNSPSIATRDDVVTAALLLVVGLTVGELAVWALRQRDRARQGRVDLVRIHHAAELMAQGGSAERLVEAVSLELTDLFSLSACRFDPGPPDPLMPHLDHDGAVRWGDLVWGTSSLGFPHKGVTLEAHGHGRAMGAFTMTPKVGVMIDAEQLVVAVALADQVGAALAGFQPA
jgi:K+-sensing histidine kinase KdpD